LELEKLESRGLGTHLVDDVGCVLWVLLVEGHRYESYDVLEVVESDGSQGPWGMRSGCTVQSGLTLRHRELSIG
jgi:hypothetical protein